MENPGTGDDVAASKIADQATATAPPAETRQKQADQPAHDGHDSDSDSDLDELDDVLDDFSKPKAQPAPASVPAPADTGAPSTDFDEDAFLKQLESEMASMMGNAGGPGPSPGASAGADMQGIQASLGEGADAFAKQLEESGVPPGDFLKQLLADVMAEEGGSGAPAPGPAPGASADAGAAKPAPPAPNAAPGSNGEPPESFNDAIQRTIERMKESGDRATEAASTDDGLSDDMLAQLLKAVEAGASGAGDDGDLTKMFMGMMEQLSNKEMLYEPMKDLDGKFGPWIEQNKTGGKVSDEDMQRYESQARIVKQIVQKFEEPGYTDENPKCREYVWERMQEMQAAGSPPEELISNPLMENFGEAANGAGGVPDCPQQ